MVKNPPVNAGDTGDTSSIPGSGRYPGVRNGNPLWYSWTGEPGRLQSMGSQRVRHNLATEHPCTAHPCTAHQSVFKDNMVFAFYELLLLNDFLCCLNATLINSFFEPSRLAQLI